MSKFSSNSCFSPFSFITLNLTVPLSQSTSILTSPSVSPLIRMSPVLSLLPFFQISPKLGQKQMALQAEFLNEVLASVVSSDIIPRKRDPQFLTLLSCRAYFFQFLRSTVFKTSIISWEDLARDTIRLPSNLKNWLYLFLTATRIVGRISCLQDSSFSSNSFRMLAITSYLTLLSISRSNSFLSLSISFSLLLLIFLSTLLNISLQLFSWLTRFMQASLSMLLDWRTTLKEILSLPLPSTLQFYFFCKHSQYRNLGDSKIHLRGSGIVSSVIVMEQNDAVYWFISKHVKSMVSSSSSTLLSSVQSRNSSS